MELGLTIQESHDQVVGIKEYNYARAETFVGDGVAWAEALPRFNGKVFATSGRIVNIFRVVSSVSISVFFLS